MIDVQRLATGEEIRPRRRDAAASRERLLTAAASEFVAHGVAGARVDRIAAAAGANKRLIYDYFGDKDALFDAALDRFTEDAVRRGARLATRPQLKAERAAQRKAITESVRRIIDPA